MYSCFEITMYITFSENFLKILQLFYKNVHILQYLSMFIKEIIDIVENFKKILAWYTLLVDDLEFTTPCWSATSSLLHLNQF